MTLRIGRFEMPSRVGRDESSATGTFGRFFLEPLEPGYGRTVGNALRRVLLSSLEGAAISSLQIEQAHHEFSSIPGMVEDVTDMILNLKKVLLKLHTREPRTLSLRAKGPGEVTAADIQPDAMLEVMNPTHHIATLAEDGKLNLTLEVTVGRGFVPGTLQQKKDDSPTIGLIPVDALYSPVRRANFLVENTRVGKRTDYEKLTLEIWTDERITPEDALIHAAVILRHHLDVFVNYHEDLVSFDEGGQKTDRDRDLLKKKLAMSVNEIELSVRAANCLNNANILTVGELAQKTESEMLKYRNFGRKSLQEIALKLKEMGLSFGMTFPAG